MTRPLAPGDRVYVSIAYEPELHTQTGTIVHIDESDILPYHVMLDDSGEGALPTYFCADELTIIDPVTNPTYTEDAGQ